MRRLFLLISFLIVSLIALAQDGNYYLTHYKPNLKDIDNNNFALLQDKEGLICIANRNGLLKFDGRVWRVIKTPGSLFSLCLGQENELYVGGNYGFGVIRKDKEGKEKYYDLLKENKDSVSITKIEKIADKIYFMSNQLLFEYDYAKEVISNKWEAEGNKEYQNIIQHNQELYVDISDNSFLKISDEGLLQPSKLSPPNNKSVIFSIQLQNENNTSLIGLSDNKLYLFDGTSFQYFKTSNDSYLINNKIKDASLVSKEKIAVVTNTGGCLLINSETGEIIEYVGDYSGLPDDEILAITSDESGGLWVAHEFGLSRIAAQIPLYDYSHYPGLEGNIMDIQPFGDHLYIATSLGLLYLDKVKNIDEVSFRLQHMVTANCDPNPERRSFFNRLLNRVISKKKQQSGKQKQPPKKRAKKLLNKIKSNIKGESNKYFYTYSAQQLEGVKHLYKPVKGMDIKCTQLISTETSLLASSFNGIYEIKNLIAKQIYNQGVKYLHKSENGNKIYATTLTGKAIILEYGTNNSWKVNKELNIELTEPISHVLESKEHLWFCGNKNIFKFGLESSILEKLPIHNKFNDEILPVGKGGKVYFVSSSGIYVYNEQENKIVKDDKLYQKFGKIEKTIDLGPSKILLFNGDTWQYLGQTIDKEISFSQLRIFKDVENVVYDEKNSLIWASTAKNNVYKIDITKQKELKTNQKFSLQRIENAKGKQLSTKSLKIKQQESEVKFIFSMPDFLGQANVDYQYKLEGKADSKWSAWSKENNAYFNFLPKGNYTLMVKTRDALGEERIHEVTKFKVLPPYWESVWFYILEVLFFGGLVVFSTLLSQASTESKYLQKISRVLAFFTLILVIQLMDSIVKSVFNINSQTPVSEFFIEVSIAIVLFPMEKRLEKFMNNQKIKMYLSKTLNIDFEKLSLKLNSRIEFIVLKVENLVRPIIRKGPQEKEKYEREDN